VSTVSIRVPDHRDPEVSASRFLIYPHGELHLERFGIQKLLARKDGSTSCWTMPERHCGGNMPMPFSCAEEVVIAAGEDELFSGRDYCLYHGDGSGTNWTDEDVVLVHHPDPSTYTQVAVAEGGRWQIRGLFPRELVPGMPLVVMSTSEATLTLRPLPWTLKPRLGPRERLSGLAGRFAPALS
jgi:hypothetical protein